MSGVAYVIAITRTERDCLLRIIRGSDEYNAGREPACSVLAMLESALTPREAQLALMEIGEPD